MITFISPIDELQQSSWPKRRFETRRDVLIELRRSDAFRRSGLVRQLFTGCAFQTVEKATWKLFAAAKARRAVDVPWWRVKFRITTWAGYDEDWLLGIWSDRLWDGSEYVSCLKNRYAASLTEDLEREVEEFFADGFTKPLPHGDA
jgi:hypothetical protein